MCNCIKYCSIFDIYERLSGEDKCVILDNITFAVRYTFPLLRILNRISHYGVAKNSVNITFILIFEQNVCFVAKTNNVC